MSINNLVVVESPSKAKTIIAKMSAMVADQLGG